MNEIMNDTADSIGSGINFASLRLPQDYANVTAVKKVITTIPMRKPDKQWFIRVHPEWKFECAAIEIEEGMRKETYVVMTSLVAELPREVVPKVLYLATNRQKTLFFWPIRLPSPDGRLDNWNESARIAAERAKHHWVRVVPEEGCYGLYEAQGNLSDPEWPADLTLDQVLEIAFKGKIIDGHHHPILRRLRGEI